MATKSVQITLKISIVMNTVRQINTRFFLVDPFSSLLRQDMFEGASYTNPMACLKITCEIYGMS